MLNRSGESGHPCLVPDFRWKSFSFSLLSMILAEDLLCMAFSMLRYFPYISTLLSVLINPCCILSNLLCFVNVLYCIDRFAYIELSLCPLNPTWWWLLFFFNVFHLLVFCLGFLHLYSSDILVHSFLFCVLSFRFGIRIMLASSNVLGSIASYSVFWKSLR